MIKSYLPSFVFLVLLCLSCNFNRSYVNEDGVKEEAMKFVDSFYYHIEYKEWEKTYRYLFKEFLIHSSELDLKKILERNYEEYGDYYARFIDEWSSLRTVSNGQEIVECVFLIKAQYKNGECIEKMGLLKEDGEYKVLSYFIQVRH